MLNLKRILKNLVKIHFNKFFISKLILRNELKNIRKTIYILLIFLILLFLLITNILGAFKWISRMDYSLKYARDGKVNTINLVGIICGQQLYPEFETMLKSAVVFQNYSSPKLHFIIITEYIMRKRFQNKFLEWSSVTNNSFTYEIRNISVTEDGSKFKLNRYPLKCAMERIFLPNKLSNIDKVLYVDADILFLTPLSDIWSHFEKMNSTQICGAATDNGDIENNWYKVSKRVPYYGVAGLNSGVMLMNLKKMREINWTSRVMAYAEEYKAKISLSDQDPINIYFHFHPERVLQLSHRYNVHQYHFRSPTEMCRDCMVHGIRIIHGIMGMFISGRTVNQEEPIYLIYQILSTYVVGTDPRKHLLEPIIASIRTRRREHNFSIQIMKIYLEHTDTFAFAFSEKTPNFD